MRIFTIVLMGSLLMSGCAGNRAIYVPHTPGLYPEKPVGSPVILTYTDKLDHPYEEMGALFASARSRNKYGVVAELLKEKARQVGADAVIKVQYKEKQIFGISPFFISVPYNVAAGEGVAVHYIEVQKGSGEKTTSV